ncbi:MAG: L-lactate dehydrogenase, partial [Clostridiales bacterium]|nr:L-lactate dehydrogenase [Clostridiales bacterium]MDR1092762.1 L-lactate dehydrogenase [Clostridiales bacterium]
MGKKISVIGCGKVGATTAFAIAARGLVDEIVMMDVAK